MDRQPRVRRVLPESTVVRWGQHTEHHRGALQRSILGEKNTHRGHEEHFGEHGSTIREHGKQHKVDCRGVQRTWGHDEHCGGLWRTLHRSTIGSTEHHGELARELAQEHRERGGGAGR